MSDDERWRKIPGWPYEVSDKGRVRRSEDGRGTFPGRIMSVYKGRSGYEHVHLSNEGIGKTFRVHRLVLRAFAGPCPEGQEADHINGDRADNRLANLRWLDIHTNRSERIRGEDAPVVSLTERDVADIRKRYAGGEASQVELAGEYGVHFSSVSQVVRGETWAHADGPISESMKEGGASLTEHQVAEMRELYDAGGVSQRDLAEVYDMSQSAVASVLRGETWAHAGGPISKNAGTSGPKTVTEREVREIRRRYEAGGVFQRELAEEFGISESQVGRIVRYEHWPDVEPGQAQEAGDAEGT